MFNRSVRLLISYIFETLTITKLPEILQGWSTHIHLDTERLRWENMIEKWVILKKSAP